MSKLPAVKPEAVRPPKPGKVDLGTGEAPRTAGLRGGDFSDQAPLAPGGATQLAQGASPRERRRAEARTSGEEQAYAATTRLASSRGEARTEGKAPPRIDGEAPPASSSQEVMTALAARTPKNLWGTDE